MRYSWKSTCAMLEPSGEMTVIFRGGSMKNGFWTGGCLALALSCTAVNAGTVTYVYTDPLGTPLAEADTNGVVMATFDYAPYGHQVLGSSVSGPGYTGHVNDADTGLVYMQARYYDPDAGRFLSVDPVVIKPEELFSFNRFVYANANPIVRIDPDGRDNVLKIVARLPDNLQHPTETDKKVQHAAQRSVDLTVNAVLAGGTDEQKANAAKWTVSVDPTKNVSATGGTATTWGDQVKTTYYASIEFFSETTGDVKLAGGVTAKGSDAALLVIGGHELAHTTAENRAMAPGVEKENNASKQAVEMSKSSPEVKPELIHQEQ